MVRGGTRRDVHMGRRSRYTEEFHRDAVALPRTADGTRTYAAVSSDLGISSETLRTWVRTDNASGQGSAADHADSHSEGLGQATRKRTGCPDYRPIP
ncbi:MULTISPECIES: transposase [Rhodococcus]|uniref:transposase n=1 Tax=Rhodococcus TaxID=1827 RepID=UPI000E6AF37E